MKGFVYLLKSDDGNKYVGSTNDINRRIKEHLRKHKNSQYTRTKQKLKLIYFEEYETFDLARRIEKSIKQSRTKRDRFYERAGLEL